MVLSRVHRILDEVSKSRRIIVCIQTVVKRSPFNLPWIPMMMPRVAQRSLSGTLNLDRYDSIDGQLRFTLFSKTNHHLVRVHHVPLSSSEDQ